MWLTGLVAPWHVGSSQTRARTRVPCIGRQILNHCATREALAVFDVRGLTLIELWDGLTAEDIEKSTRSTFAISPNLRPMQQVKT